MATTWATGATDIRQREALASGHRARTPWGARGVTTWSFVADVAPAPCQSGTDMRLKLSTLSVCLMSALAGPVVAQQGATSGEWRSYSGDLGSTKYSPLDQIDRDNVQDLEIAWRWKTDNFGASVERYSRVTPIMVNGVLYATAGLRRATVAIDAVTGETLWMHRMDEGVRGDNAPRRSSGRGVAYWSGRPDESDAQIFMITPGYRLVALDAATGRPVPNFGQDGVVDLKLGLDRPVDLIEAVIGSSSPPVVVGDVVVVGAALEVGSSPPTKENAPGHVRGYDARTGERLWIFHTIPQPGEFGHETWEDDSWSYTGNVAVWPPFSADAELGYVYLPVEAGTGDYYGGHRPGNNLFSQSLVALDARTGERIWHFQMVHHGIWDYDPASPPILADIVVDGRPIKAIAQVTKQAFTYVFDRVTGEPVWPIEERPVGESDVPMEWTAPTQPFPTRPAPFDRQGVSLDDLIDFTPEIKAAAIDSLARLRIGPIYTPPSLAEAPDGTRGTIQLPGTLGGANWPGASFDPETGVLYVGSATAPSLRTMVNDPDRSNMNYIQGSGGLPRPLGLPLIKPPWGRITAIDLNTGDHLWMVANGDTPQDILDNPALQGVEIPKTGQNLSSGAMVTKTLLFVIGGWRGAGEPELRVHDKATGELLATIDLPAIPNGVPMTYMAEDRQYIVMSVGNRDHPPEFVALALP